MLNFTFRDKLNILAVITVKCKKIRVKIQDDEVRLYEW